MPAPVVTNKFAFADGSTGHSCDLGSAPSAGEWDALCIGSNTVVTSVPGFTQAEPAVGNQGAYIYVREAGAGEAQTATITTSGNHDTDVTHLRLPATVVAVDTSTSTQANGAAGNSTPTHSTGPLAETGEYVIAFGALHSIGSANQNTPVWSAGYTSVFDVPPISGSGATGVVGFVAYKEGAGTAAETPQVSWSGDGCQNRYMLAVTFTVDLTPPVGRGAPVVLSTTTGRIGSSTTSSSFVSSTTRGVL